MISKEDFELLTTDTDAFMKEHGYERAEVLSSRYGYSADHILHLAEKGEVERVQVGLRVYIKCDSDRLTVKRNHDSRRGDPDEYITVSEWAKYHRCSRQLTYNFVTDKRLKSKKINGVIMVKRSEPYPERKKKRSRYVSNSQRRKDPDSAILKKGYASALELCKEYNVSINVVRHALRLGAIKGIKAGGLWYVHPDAVKIIKEWSDILSKGYLTVSEYSEKTGVSRQCVIKAIQSGKIPEAVRGFGAGTKYRWYLPEHVECFSERKIVV